MFTFKIPNILKRKKTILIHCIIFKTNISSVFVIVTMSKPGFTIYLTSNFIHEISLIIFCFQNNLLNLLKKN